MTPAPQPRITTLVYAIHDGAVLLLHRRKEPNLGLWSPPGGKVEPGETPLDNALRELKEETGATGLNPRLAVVVSELDPVLREAWLMFVFQVDVDAGDPAVASPVSDGREGLPVWVPLADVAGLATPAADGRILEAVLRGGDGVAFLNARYEDGVLASVVERWA